MSSITFRLESCLVKTEDIEKCVKDKYGGVHTVRKAVTVKMADLRWFMRDLKQFLKFCELLSGA